tara:strand:+ start:3910 stop:4074 length:165 start_codon:yes stop_codon:yes gene_type:complete
MSIAFTDWVMDQQEKQIEQIMQDIENVQGPLADQEALYEEALEIYEKQNQVEEG